MIDVEKASIVTDAVERLTTEYDDLPAGTEARAEAHLLEQAQVFDAPTLRRLGKRLFEVVCPEAADAAEGAEAGEGRGQGPGARVTSRSTTTATAPATDGSGCPPCTRTC